MGKLIKQKRNGEEAAELIQNFYDGRGNLTKQINALGEITEVQYDAMNRKVKAISGNKEEGFMESIYEYDETGNLIQESYGLATSEKRGIAYTYDHLGRKIKEIDELGNSISYTYDAAGNLSEYKDKNGVITNYTYDGLGRLIKEINSKDEEYITSDYDILGRKNKVEDNTGEYLFKYDQYSNLIQVRNPLEITQNYTYDKLRRVASYIEEQSGTRNQKLSYTYDQAGRLTNLYTDIANVGYSYDHDGKLISETNSTTNEVTQYSYDLLSRMTEKNIWQKDKLQSSQKYSYDLLGRKTEEIMGTDYTLYFYDALGRIEESVEGSSEIKDAYSNGKITSYSYDPYSNLTEKSIWQDNGRLKESYTYNEVNQLTSKRVDGQTELLNYDKQGNLTEKKEVLPGGTYFTDYTYDGKNRLAGVNNNGEVQSAYEYRYDGLRFSKTVDGDTNYFTYNGGNITSELTSEGTYNYYRGLSMIGISTPQKENYYYTQNNKGDIIGLKDATGNAVKTYSYDPFGNQEKDTEKLAFDGVWKNETEQVYNPFGYCGEYQDAETGFVYLRGRYYDPATERFITEDPMKDGGNWYAYCGNDPVNHIDPSGYFMSGDDKYAGISNVYGTIADATMTYIKYEKQLKNADPTSSRYANIKYEMNKAHKAADDARALGDAILAQSDAARHTTLDAAGAIPGAGIVPDSLNTALYAMEGDWGNAGISGTAALPFGSGFAIVSRYGDTVVDVIKGGLKIDIDVKPTVTNEKLKNIINDLYKGQGGANTIGNGTTMDAVRNEILTGQATNGKFHTSKLNDYVNALEKRLRAGDLNPNDEAVVKALLEDAKNALSGN